MYCWPESAAKRISGARGWEGELVWKTSLICNLLQILVGNTSCLLPDCAFSTCLFSIHIHSFFHTCASSTLRRSREANVGRDHSNGVATCQNKTSTHLDGEAAARREHAGGNRLARAPRAVGKVYRKSNVALPPSVADRQASVQEGTGGHASSRAWANPKAKANNSWWRAPYVPLFFRRWLTVACGLPRLSEWILGDGPSQFQGLRYAKIRFRPS